MLDKSKIYYEKTLNLRNEIKARKPKTLTQKIIFDHQVEILDELLGDFKLIDEQLNHKEEKGNAKL